MTHLLLGLLAWKPRSHILPTATVVVLFLSGCASQVYRPTELPAEFAAQPCADLQTLDLSSLAGPLSTPDVICWGDLITMEIDAGLPSLEPRVSSVRVAKDGTVKVPLIGHVPVAGLEVESAEAAIIAAARSGGIYPNPYVSVQIAQPRNNRVTVVGAVASPGVYRLPRGSSSLMTALVNAGGLADTASGDVEMRHTDPRLAARATTPPGSTADDPDGMQLVSHESPMVPNDGVLRINLLEAAASGTGNLELQDGDVINVIPRDLPPIHVLGLVKKPGEFEMVANRETYLLDALAMAGGLSTQVADRVTIRRRLPDQAEPVTIVASIRKAMDGKENLLLAPGDTVMVRQTAETVVVDIFKSFIRVSLGGSMALF
ncbi:MAG: SLBB domain-containing protein [Pirellulales bacterium]|nr:SLBB domain-containing protein [Pirellulales bacterium]